MLGTLNIGAFFALLFVAAYLLPGGLVATVGAVQPLIVAFLASRFLGERITGTVLAAGAAGILGVALLVLQSQAQPVGVLAALGGAASMALGIVLSKKWGQPDAPLAATSWQLVAGGIVLVPLLLLVEGLPHEGFSLENTAGFAFLSLVGTAFAYTVWYRGIQLLPAASISFLGLLSPVVAVLAGWAILGQSLAAGQLLGTSIVLVSLGFVLLRHRPAHPQTGIRRSRATLSRSPEPLGCPEAR